MFTYTCYGYDTEDSKRPSQLGFNGEHRETLTSSYGLGKGYRLYSTVLMRFNSPDSYSPFADGGLNAYGYCAGDPVNLIDPDGHMPVRHPPSRSPSPPSRSGAQAPLPRGRARNRSAEQARIGRGRAPSPSPNRPQAPDGNPGGNGRESRSSSSASDDRNYQQLYHLRRSPSPQPRPENLAEQLIAAAQRLNIRRDIHIYHHDGPVQIIQNPGPRQAEQSRHLPPLVSELRDSRSPSR